MIYCSWYSNNIGNIDNSEETAVPGQRVRAYAYVGMRAPAQTGGRAGGRAAGRSWRAPGQQGRHSLSCGWTGFSDMERGWEI